MGLGALVWMGCSSPSGGATSPYGTASPDSSADAGATGIGDGEGGATGSPTVGALSSREVESLTFTREEEKLARDVYGALSAKDPLFSNIGKSEQTHMDAIATLLTRYGLPDPVGTNGPGKFSNATLQALYDALVAEGARSNLSALAVGVEIEELDIFDIELAKKDVTHADVLATYDTLTRGSRNHLRSFYGKLVAAGGSYTPKHLDAASFKAIVDSAMERGP